MHTNVYDDMYYIIHYILYTIHHVLQCIYIYSIYIALCIIHEIRTLLYMSVHYIHRSGPLLSS